MNYSNKMKLYGAAIIDIILFIMACVLVVLAYIHIYDESISVSMWCSIGALIGYIWLAVGLTDKIIS